MADQIFSKIQLPNSDKAWYKYGVYPVIGTQTADTEHWTGNIDVPALYDGLTIAYYLPRNGVSSKNVDLNLTLKDGTTTTGAIACYNTNNSRITTHYSAGTTIILTYWSAGSISVNGTATTVATWRHANYDSNSNTYDRTYHNGAIKAKTAIVAGNLIVGDSGGYWHLKAGTAFDITYHLLYASAAIAANATATNTYMIIPFTVTTTQSITLTAYKAVFIKGTLNGTIFTPASTAPLTQTIPSTADGYQYMYVGDAYSTTAVYLMPDHPIYEYKDGAFRLYGSTDNNTTYTFANGTNGFTVTPAGGTAQTVTVTPSITNNVTGTGTNSYLTKWNGTHTITNGPQLDGTTTNKCLTPKGTWETFTSNTGTVTNVSLSAGTGMSVTGSPISTTGTITVTNTAPHVDGKNIVGNASTATANATTATTNTTTFLNHIENTTVKSHTQIKGAGGTTVAAQSGVVTITGLSIGTTAATAMAGNTAVNKVSISSYSPSTSVTCYPTFAHPNTIDTNAIIRYNKYMNYLIRISNTTAKRYIGCIYGGPTDNTDPDNPVLPTYGFVRVYSQSDGYATITATLTATGSATHKLGTTSGTIVDDGDVVTDNVNRPILLANCSTGSTPGTAPLTNRNNNIYANGSTGKIGCKGLTGSILSIDATASLDLNGGTSGTTITGENVSMNAGSGYSLSAAYATLGCSQYMAISSGLTDENDSGITIEGYHVTINDQSSTNTVNIGTYSNSTINIKGSAVKINDSATSNNSVAIGSTSYSTTEIEGKTVSIESNVSSGQGSVSISSAGPNGGNISLTTSGVTGTVTISGCGTAGRVNITAQTWDSVSNATYLGVDSSGKIVKRSSARRYKDYIDYDIDRDDYHNQLMMLKPCTYEYKQLPGDQSLGLIADDVYEINPQLVNYNDNFEIESYRNDDVMTMLIIEAQRKDKEIEDLKQQINNLTYLVNQLMNGNVNNE